MKIILKITLLQFEYHSSDYPDFYLKILCQIIHNKISQNSHFWGNLVSTRFKLIFFSLQFLILNNNKTWYRPWKNSRSFLVIFFQNNAYLAFLLVFCRFIYFFSEITCSRIIDFKKVYQAVNRPSNTDSTFNNYSMPQYVYD